MFLSLDNPLTKVSNVCNQRYLLVSIFNSELDAAKAQFKELQI